MSPKRTSEFMIGGIGMVLIGKIEPRHDLLSALKKMVEDAKIESRVILSVIGRLRRAVLRNVARFPEQQPITDADRFYKEVDCPRDTLHLGNNHKA